MINLLPIDDKKEILAGRSNRLLVRYILLFLALAVFMILSLVAVYIYLSNTKSVAEANIASNENDSRELLAKQQEVNAFKSDLATAKQILDKQVNYSSIILKAAGVIPSGIIIDNLTLDPETIGTPTKFNARAKSEQAAIRFKDALNKSPYFENAYFDTISTEESESNSGYAYSVIMTVTFTRELLND